MDQDPTLELRGKIFLEDPKAAKADPTAPKPGIPGPIHLVRRGDYLCKSPRPCIRLMAGGLIREYEENRRMLIEQKAVIASMPVKEGFGYEHPPLPASAAGSSRSKLDSPTISIGKDISKDIAKDTGKGKRRKTPEYTDSEEESSQYVLSLFFALTISESMDEDAVKEALRPAKKHLVGLVDPKPADTPRKSSRAGPIT